MKMPDDFDEAMRLMDRYPMWNRYVVRGRFGWRVADAWCLAWGMYYRDVLAALPMRTTSTHESRRTGRIS